MFIQMNLGGVLLSFKAFIFMRIIRLTFPRTGDISEKRAKVIIYLHGGAYCYNSINSYRAGIDITLDRPYYDI